MMAYSGIFFFVFIFAFIFIMGTIIFMIVKGISQWSYNNTQPALSVLAKITAKRAHSSHHNHMVNNHMHHSTSTSYYVTFEVESGDRLELRVPAREYGMLAEDDFGTLTFQGTRYLGFERQL